MQGIKANIKQFILQIIQVFCVGIILGIERNIIPILAVDEFKVSSISVIMAFIMSFGFVKALLNLYGGILSDKLGRKRVLVIGWISAVPIPLIFIYAPSWRWIILGNILLGVNQGLSWSMTVTSQLDISKASERGLAAGLNEFSGYIGMTLGVIVSAFISKWYGPRTYPFVFGFGVIIFALSFAVFLVTETRHLTIREQDEKEGMFADNSGFFSTLRLVLSSDTMLAVSQAGHVEKYVDALVWVSFPLLFHKNQLSLVEIGLITSVYGFTWSVLQLFTGILSDRIGRKWLITFGMWICALGVLLTVSVSGISGWYVSAFVTGVGMALLYPTLIATISDLAVPGFHGTFLGVYRFWRDSGYGLGALLIGVLSDVFGLNWGFYCVGVLMFFSGLIVALRMEETA